MYCFISMLCTAFLCRVIVIPCYVVILYSCDVSASEYNNCLVLQLRSVCNIELLLLYMSIVFSVLLISIVVRMAGFGIRQSFPKNDTYCCHCPSLSMECKFPPGVSIVWWSIPDKRITNIPVMQLDHMIDNSKISEGVSKLTVADVSSLEARYGCIVFFPNGSSIEYDDKSHPPQRGKCTTPTCPACTSRQDIESTHLWHMMCI